MPMPKALVATTISHLAAHEGVLGHPPLVGQQAGVIDATAGRRSAPAISAATSSVFLRVEA